MFIGSACQNKVLNTLRRKFKSPEEADLHYFPKNLVASDPTAVAVATVTPSLLNSPENQELKVISDLYKLYCSSCSSVIPPDDFLKLALSAMKHLQSCSPSNVFFWRCFVVFFIKVLAYMQRHEIAKANIIYVPRGRQ